MGSQAIPSPLPPLQPSLSPSSRATPPPATSSAALSTTPTFSLSAELASLEEDLDTALFRRLCRPAIFNHLHWAGFKGNYTPLSKLAIYRRNIVRVHDHALHLVWKSNIQTHFIKPLPLVFTEPNLDLDLLGPRSRGLLYSYTQLVRSELDYTVAKEFGLLPADFSNDDPGWKKWKALADAFRNDHGKHRSHNNSEHLPSCLGTVRCRDAQGNPCHQFKLDRNADLEKSKKDDKVLLDSCHPRYTYGNLRLDRINWIVRLNIHLSGWDFYRTRTPRDTFAYRHSQLITAYIFYVAVILTAMQVALQAFPDGWAVAPFGIFGYVVVFFTGVQIPIILGVGAGWIVYQLVYFWYVNHTRGGWR
jgi:hypothetical protein